MKSDNALLIELCLKTLNGQKDHHFNLNEKVKVVVQWAVNNFPLDSQARKGYNAYLELGDGNRRQLNLDLSLKDQGVVDGSCIRIVPPENVDG